MNKQWTLVTAGIIVIVIGAAGLFIVSSKEDPASQATSEENVEFPTLSDRSLIYEVAGVLDDVSNSGSNGTAEATYFDDGTYELIVEFQELAATSSDDFYEGWLVNQATKDFFSTGVIKVDSNGQMINTYESNVDHQVAGYDFYVLTLEPDDGDPAPAKHIIEGKLKVVE